MHYFALENNPQVFTVFRDINEMACATIWLYFLVYWTAPRFFQPFVFQIGSPAAHDIVEIGGGFHTSAMPRKAQ